MVYEGRERRGSDKLREMIKKENEKHKKTLDGQMHTTLSEEEILSEPIQTNILTS